jgi:hypothetical protein
VPKHVLTMVAAVGAFFALLWFGMVVLGQTPGRAMLLSLLTLLLIGLGVSFSAGAFHGDDQRRS